MNHSSQTGGEKSVVMNIFEKVDESKTALDASLIHVNSCMLVHET